MRRREVARLSLGDVDACNRRYNLVPARYGAGGGRGQVRMLVCAAAVAFVLAACSSAIKLRNPATGETATCGPYMLDSLASDSQAQREARCLSDYQRQGFQRVPD